MLIRRFGDNPFGLDKYSNGNVVNYAIAHLQLMIAHDATRLGPRITATSDVLDLVASVMTDEMTKVAMQKSRTASKVTFRQALPGHITQIHGSVVAAFGADAPELLQCFPQGRTIFSTSTDEALGKRLGQLVTSITPLSAAVGSTHVTAATGLATTWDTLYGAQGDAKGATSVSAETRAAAMKSLKLELFKNLLTIILNDPEDPDRIDLLCPYNLLEGRSPATTPGVTTLTLASQDAQPRTAHFTMTADGAESFRVLRGIAGEADLTQVAEGILPVDGVATYAIYLEGTSAYQFAAEAVHGTRIGERSSIVIVPAV